MPFDRPALVAQARETIARGSKSFAAASTLFGRETRERVWLLYAWCRACDDLADAQDMGGALGDQAGAAERLARIRSLTAMALAGEPSGEPSFDAFAVVAAECGITAEMAEDVIAGFALDAAEWTPRSEADLLQYCFHVAGAVGVMMAVVMGVAANDEDTLDRACDLGLAFQLGNIARDVAEDDRAGRCYLPAEWLAEADIPPGEQMKPPYREALMGAAGRLCRLAEDYEASARVGAARLGFRERWAVLAAAGIYGAIARKVAARGGHAWDRRVSTGKWEKLGHLARGWWQALPWPEPKGPRPQWHRRALAARARQASGRGVPAG
ncbi:phytoene/squalene synthase family protein [Novosphingobium flavum]|uniref:Phytoene/squalene synthase family protein n=1 Tax=Novosphingobium flavum TaxID=1778672 RepID=A0A7X1FS14_9SPHN|nr:phytoene/squalene synthase family protein [Novosphingobium flavum]MBC2665916.1 phytoene/squalene synthase family protein [Novosphingobium flavum]